MSEEIKKLQDKISKQKKEIRAMQIALERKNFELDVLHFVWCSGNCKAGVHRFCKKALTKEIVKEVVRNTQRLVTKFNNLQFDHYEVRDKFYYFKVMRPRKLYHKILKWFINLVSY